MHKRIHYITNKFMFIIDLSMNEATSYHAANKQKPVRRNLPFFPFFVLSLSLSLSLSHRASTKVIGKVDSNTASIS